MFMPLSFVQRELAIRGRVNTILVSVKPGAVVEGGALEEHVRRRATLDDVGLSVTSIDERGVLAVNSSAGLLTETQARAALEAIQLSG